MCFGRPFPRFRRGKKEPSTTGERPGGRRAVAGDEESHHSASSVRSEPSIWRLGELGGDIGAGLGIDLVSGNPRPVSQPPVERTSGQRRSDDYGDRQGRSQRFPYLEAHAMARGEPSRGRRSVDGQRIIQVNPPRSDSDTRRKIPTSSISRGSEGT